MKAIKTIQGVHEYSRYFPQGRCCYSIQVNECFFLIQEPAQLIAY